MNPAQYNLEKALSRIGDAVEIEQALRRVGGTDARSTLRVHTTCDALSQLTEAVKHLAAAVLFQEKRYQANQEERES